MKRVEDRIAHPSNQCCVSSPGPRPFRRLRPNRLFRQVANCNRIIDRRCRFVNEQRPALVSSGRDSRSDRAVTARFLRSSSDFQCLDARGTMKLATAAGASPSRQFVRWAAVTEGHGTYPGPGPADGSLLQLPPSRSLTTLRFFVPMVLSSTAFNVCLSDCPCLEAPQHIMGYCQAGRGRIEPRSWWESLIAAQRVARGIVIALGR